MDRAWFQCLNMIYDETLSKFAFKLNLRRFTEVDSGFDDRVTAALTATAGGLLRIRTTDGQTTINR